VRGEGCRELNAVVVGFLAAAAAAAAAAEAMESSSSSSDMRSMGEDEQWRAASDIAAAAAAAADGQRGERNVKTHCLPRCLHTFPADDSARRRAGQNGGSEVGSEGKSWEKMS
jgi:hypothetical protein